MTEVEVNGEGQWRPNGTNLPWRSTVTDTDPLTMSAIKIKPEPQQAPDCEPLPCSRQTELHAAHDASTTPCVFCVCTCDVCVGRFSVCFISAMAGPDVQVSGRRSISISLPN